MIKHCLYRAAVCLFVIYGALTIAMTVVYGEHGAVDCFMSGLIAFGWFLILRRLRQQGFRIFKRIEHV